jgi:hypothetical protein
LEYICIIEKGITAMTTAANDNKPILVPSVDMAITGQALTITQAHRKFGRCYAEFAGHAGDGKHILVRKLISGTYRARWTRPLKVERSQIIAVHTCMARVAC